jgi:Ca-activated chloride channel family protein
MFRFQHPEYLFLLFAVPLLLGLFVLLLLWRNRKLRALGKPALVSAQVLGRIPGRATAKAVVFLLALAVAIIGAANLQGGGRPEQVQRKGVDVIIALDVSKSMLAKDLQPDRLSRAKQLIERLLDKLHNDRVGLIIFAGRAYLQVPLTVDYSSMRMMLQNARPDLVPTQGTVIGEAIELAEKSFSQKERKYKSLIIISDGEDHDAQAQDRTKDARENGVIVHTVGIGSPQGIELFDESTNAPKMDEHGNPVVTKLNEEELKSIAATGHGSYTLLRNADQAANGLAEQIDGMEGRSLATMSFTDYESYFQFFLLPALLLLLFEWLLPGAGSPKKWTRS